MISIRLNKQNKTIKIVNRRENIRLRHSGVGPAGAGLPAGGTTDQILVKDSNADYDYEWQDQTAGLVTSVNSQTGAVVLDKTDIGLSNVDNTSDANKPVSTAMQSALDDKADKITVGIVAPSSPSIGDLWVDTN